MNKGTLLVVLLCWLPLSSASGRLFDPFRRSVEEAVKEEAGEAIGDTVRDALGGEEDEPPAIPAVTEAEFILLELGRHSLTHIGEGELPPKPNDVGMRDYAARNAANRASHHEFLEAYSKYMGERVAEMHLAKPVAHWRVYKDLSTDAFKMASKRFSR